MESEFWHDRWQKQEIGFHQTETHDLLEKYWPTLGLPQGSAVFVPLCGKSLDMVWLVQQGHKVIGAELSAIAVDAFFAERGLVPQEKAVGSFTVKSAGPYELWLGDVFEMPGDAVAEIAGTYDRAALIAFPPEMKPRYAEKLTALQPAKAPILLITLDFDQSQMAGPPFTTPRTQVESFYGNRFEITELENRDALVRDPFLEKRGLKALQEHVYRLRRK